MIFAFPTPVHFTVISPAIIRLLVDRGESGQSYAIEGAKTVITDFQVKDARDHYTIPTAALSVH
ncbi:hypothetical protein E5289_19385, partial [Lactiplantibacillus pentosus]